jgi:hypothetical protein
VKAAISAVLISLLVTPAYGKDKDPKPEYDTEDAGGSIPVKAGSPLGLTMTSDKIVFYKIDQVKSIAVTYSRHVALLTEIDPHTITSLTYSNSKRHRVAEGLGASIGSFGVGLAIMATKETKHYISLTWDDHGNKGGVALRVDKNEYRGIIKSLEAVTGQHCTDDVTGVQR